MPNTNRFLSSWKTCFVELEDQLVETGQWSDSEYDEFYKDSLHGREHALSVIKTLLDWVKRFEFDSRDGFDLEVLVVAGFLHDVKGLGASGSEKRKKHHEEGASCAKIVLNKMEWGKSRIEKVMHCIQAHRGLNPELNFNGFPKSYINQDSDMKPNPQILEAKLVRDSDSYQELVEPKRFDDMTDEYRPKLAELVKNGVEDHEASVYTFQPDYVKKYNSPEYLKTRAGKYEKEKNSRKIASQVPIPWEKNPYANLLLDYNRRGSARFCDRMTFLVGKLLQSADYRFYSIPEVQNLVKQSLPLHFAEYFNILKKRASLENLDFGEMLIHIVNVLKTMKNAHDHEEWQEVFAQFVGITEDYVEAL